MKKTGLFTVFGLILFTVVFILPFSAVAEGVIELKAATYHPLKHRLTEDCFKLWGQEIEKRTSGKIKIKWYLAGSLVKNAQSIDSVKTGLVDMSIPGLVWLNESQFPITNAIQLPFLVDSETHAAQVLSMMFQQVAEMQEEFADLVPIGFSTSGIMNLHFTKNIMVKTIDDLNGKRVMAPSGVIASVLKGLGAAPMTLKTLDMYPALEKGMAEGVAFPFSAARAYKLTDHLSSHTIVNFNVGPNVFIMRKASWDKLPEDVQKVFSDMSFSLASLSSRIQEIQADWIINELEKRGDQVYTMPQEERMVWREKLTFMYDEFVAKLDKRGINGRAVLDKIMAIADEARKNPVKPDSSWWKQVETK